MSRVRTDATVLLTANPAPARSKVFARYIHAINRPAPGVRHQLRGDSRQPVRGDPVRHEKGVVQRAQAGRAGKFEQANGGTLLLDEISGDAAGLQAKLLRVPQEREVERVGGKKPVALDIRVLATSNRVTWRRKASGTSFREISTIG